MYPSLKKKNKFSFCIILLLTYLLFSFFSQELTAKKNSAPDELNSKDWSYTRLETLVLRTIVARADWARLPANKFCTNGFYHSARKPVQFIGIHHDGSSDATLKTILKYHIKTNGWGDIAYHFVIDKKGQIYEGRSLDRASDTNNVFKSYGEERLTAIINILLLGNYNTEKIQTDSPQIVSAKLLTSYLYLKYPLVTMDSIRGHKDFITDSEYGKNLITCPGKNMYSPVNMIDEIKKFVNEVSILNNRKTDE